MRQGVLFQIVITDNDLPASVRQLTVVNADRVEIRKHALSMLKTAESIHFENITTLTIEQNDPRPGLRQGHVSIRLDRVHYIEMKTGSFSHWKEKTLNISVTNVAHNCIIHDAAIVSTSPLSSVALENITAGSFYSGAFATTLGTLTLRNVNWSFPCKDNTFAGRIGELSLTSVRFKGVQKGCFRAGQTWGSLTVRSCRLGDVKKLGLQGMIGDVQIGQSSFGKIRQNGFYLNVTSFSLNASSIDFLASHALNVGASGRISIHWSNITTVRENAFRRLRSNNAGKGITLYRLAITKVVKGSLRISDVKSLELRELLIRIACECNIRRQAGRLFFGGRPLGTLTRRERVRLYRNVYKNIRCLHNHTTSSLRDYHCSSCRIRLDAVCGTANKNAETASASAVSSWIPVVACVGCLLLLGTIITLLVIHHRRHSAPQRRTARTKRPPSHRITVADIQQPLPDLTQEAQQMDCQSPGDVLNSSAGCPTVDSPIYENVLGVGSGEDQALYEEISLHGELRGEIVAERKPSPQATPLYSKVNKCKNKNATSSENVAFAAGPKDSPVYAQVNKTKIKASGLSEEAAHQTPNSGTRGSAIADISETGPDGDMTASNQPVYAQVCKKKPDDKKHEVSQSAESSTVSAEGHGDYSTSDIPVYAQVFKKKPDNKDSRPGECPEPEPAPEPADTPLYKEAPELTPAGDVTRGSGSQSSHMVTSKLYGSAVPSQSQVTEGSPATLPPDRGQESSRYAEVTYSAVRPSNAEESEGIGGDLQFNALYGTSVPVD